MTWWMWVFVIGVLVLYLGEKFLGWGYQKEGAEPETLSSEFSGDDAELLKLATQYKSDGDWDKAIAALRQAQAGMLASGVLYPAATWCRLPLYLQQAGKFDEAMQEFDFLLRDLPRRARKDSGLDDKNDSRPLKNRRRLYNSIIQSDEAFIRKKMELAQAREMKKSNPVGVRATPTAQRKTFGLADAMETVKSDQLEAEFGQVCELISGAQTADERKAVMQIVLREHPAMAEAARHLQVVLDSIAIMERTKVRKTLDSRFEVAKQNQQAMFDALPYPTDPAKQADQLASLQAMYEELIQVMPAPKTKAKATT